MAALWQSRVVYGAIEAALLCATEEYQPKVTARELVKKACMVVVRRRWDPRHGPSVLVGWIWAHVASAEVRVTADALRSRFGSSQLGVLLCMYMYTDHSMHGEQSQQQEHQWTFLCVPDHHVSGHCGFLVRR